MKKINIITGNPGKFNEIKSFLDKYSILSEQIPVDFSELQDLDATRVIEHKVKEAMNLNYSNFLLEDTALYINGLNRLPGPFIKWFLIELGVEGLYNLSTTIGDRSAYAETIIAYVGDDKIPHFFQGVTLGKIVQPIGNLSFGWSSIFQPTGSDKTYGQMDFEEKQKWGQRIKALNKFKDFFLEVK